VRLRQTGLGGGRRANGLAARVLRERHRRGREELERKDRGEPGVEERRLEQRANDLAERHRKKRVRDHRRAPGLFGAGLREPHQSIRAMAVDWKSDETDRAKWNRPEKRARLVRGRLSEKNEHLAIRADAADAAGLVERSREA